MFKIKCLLIGIFILCWIQVFAQRTDVSVIKTELVENNTKINVYYHLSFLSETKTYVSQLTDKNQTYQ